MFGKNPIRVPESGDGSTLSVVNIFPTLQGEGPFAGYPSVFLRLGGCNLACDFCDTEFEQFAALAISEIVEKIDLLAREDNKRVRNLVVITGGEPLRQNIVPLCELLLAHGFQIQIETNGTLWRPLPEAVNIVCSPKISKGQYHPVRPDLLARANALKFIISASHPAYTQVGEVGQAQSGTPVYVQPMDEYDPTKNAANLKRASMLAQTRGYRLSLQLHKLLGIE